MGTRGRFLKSLMAVSLTTTLVALSAPRPLKAGQAGATNSPFEGTWIIETHLGPRPLEGTFHVNGTELTGTMKLGSGSVVPITSGTVKDNAISFGFQGENKQALMLRGKLNQDVIEFILTLPPNEDGPEYIGKRKP